MDEPENCFAWQAIGDALKKLGRTAEAISAFLNGIKVAPTHPVDFMGGTLSAAPLWYRLAHAYGDLGNVELSIEAFKKAAVIDTASVDIWNDLGVAYASADNYRGAFEAFKKAVDVDPRNLNSIKNLGLLYARCGVEQGVSYAHAMMLNISEEAASDFTVQAQKLLSNS